MTDVRATSVLVSATARGFSLIELMVAVAIVAILAAIAIPAYTAYVQRANRSEVKTQLLEAAAFLQRCFSQNNDYRCAPAAPAAMPAPYNQSPANGAAKYTIAVTAGGGAGSTTYTLTATRTGSMSDDECGDFTLTHTGVRGIVNQTAGRTAAECWGR
jgi:type IV pilus assembly protein PilE